MPDNPVYWGDHDLNRVAGRGRNKNKRKDTDANYKEISTGKVPSNLWRRLGPRKV